MSEPLADLDALERRVPRPLSAADRLRAAELIREASDLVRAAPFNTNWLDDNDEVISPMVGHVVVNAALRAFLNPGGFVTEGTGEWSGSRRSEDATVGVYLTDEERGRLASLIERPTGLWSQSVTRGPLETRSVLDCAEVLDACAEDIVW